MLRKVNIGQTLTNDKGLVPPKGNTGLVLSEEPGYDFALTINLPVDSDSPHSNSQTTIGDLILILDENIEVVDENWLINVHSPYVIATPG